jgi:acyl-CoA dehydrogenase
MGPTLLSWKRKPFARRDGMPGWVVNGEKMWTTGINVASHCGIFARTSGTHGSAQGITCFLAAVPSPGFEIGEYLWTFNMPTDHPYVRLRDLCVPDSAILGDPENGLAVAQSFVNQNRLRQAAASLGAATYCIEESVRHARTRKPFGKPLSDNQGIQFPLVELATQAEMLRLLIYKTATEMDTMTLDEVERNISDRVSMCNYWGNRLCCEAADRAMQVHGAIGYSRHKPFEHIFRHHRRYRITEGSEEIQMRKVAAFLFGYRGPRKGSFG